MRYALISDIHANLPALRGVLDDIAKRADVEFVRVEYDVDEAVKAMRESDLPGEFADQLTGSP